MNGKNVDLLKLLGKLEHQKIKRGTVGVIQHAEIDTIKFLLGLRKRLPSQAYGKVRK